MPSVRHCDRSQRRNVGEPDYGGVAMMPILEFSRTQLSRKLERLPPLLRVVFAAACAERLVPAYAAFSDLSEQGDPETITRVFKRLWEDIDGNPMTEGEVQANLSACMDLIPPDDDASLGAESGYAEDVVAALAYTLTCRQNGDSQEAMWSGEQAYNALDHFVINRDNVDLNALDAERRILADPLIQAELARQHRDINELLGAADEDVKQVAAKFRERARAEAKIFFGAPS